MAYVKTVWQTGDTITAAKLNNAEDGIESHDPIVINGVYAANETGYTVTFDISGSEMFSAYSEGKRVILHFPAQADAYLNEAYSHVLYVSRSDNGEGGYNYGAQDQYTTGMLFGSGSFSDDAVSYVVSVGVE